MGVSVRAPAPCAEILERLPRFVEQLSDCGVRCSPRHHMLQTTTPPPQGMTRHADIFLTCLPAFPPPKPQQTYFEETVSYVTGMTVKGQPCLKRAELLTDTFIQLKRP